MAEEFLTIKLHRRMGSDWDGTRKPMPYVTITCEECGFSTEHTHPYTYAAVQDMETHQIVVHSRPL